MQQREQWKTLSPISQYESSWPKITLYNVCSVHRGVFSTLGGYNKDIGGYNEYIGGYHEYIGRYHEYIGECSVHRRDTMSTSGDVQYIGGIP